MIVFAKRLMATCAIAALAITTYGCSSDNDEDRLRAELDVAQMEAAESAAEAEAAKMEATDSAAEAEAAKMKATDSAAEAEAAKMKATDSAAEAEAAKMELEQAEAGVGSLQGGSNDAGAGRASNNGCPNIGWAPRRLGAQSCPGGVRHERPRYVGEPSAGRRERICSAIGRDPKTA